MVLVMKFVEDFPLKAGARRCINLSSMFVMANLITYVCLCECLDLVMNECIYGKCVYGVILGFSIKLRPNGLFLVPYK
jgi:hypothetical protein